ncbi:unnamed protein product, partial [Chrysoparadoxa australica]
ESEHGRGERCVTTRIFSFGWGEHGRLGIGSSDLSAIPVRVPGTIFIGIPTQIAAGARHSMVLTDRGMCYSWGSNEFGQLGCAKPIDMTYSEVPVHVSLPAKAQGQSIAAGAHHSCAITVAGQLFAWGWAAEGQLGLGGETDSPFPQHVPCKACPTSNGTTSARKGRTQGYEGEPSPEERELMGLVPYMASLGHSHSIILMRNGQVQGLEDLLCSLQVTRPDLDEVESPDEPVSTTPPKATVKVRVPVIPEPELATPRSVSVSPAPSVSSIALAAERDKKHQLLIEKLWREDAKRTKKKKEERR